MADFPALPLWTDSYLADCDHLTDEEHGRYLRILVAMWRSPGCRLPNDDSWLARKFRRSESEVRTQLRPLIAEFCQTDGNWIWQKRLLKEKKRVMKTTVRQSDAAKSRWNKEKTASHGNAAPAMQPEPYPDSSDEESPLSSPKAKKTLTNGHAFDAWYEAFPHKVGKADAKKAFPVALEKAGSVDILIAGIENYVASKPRDRPWCNPATWLRQERWLDQPADNRPKSSGGLFGGAML